METAEEFIARKDREWAAERDRGTVRWMKDIGREGRMGRVREAWTWRVQANYRVKVLVVERFRTVAEEGSRAYQWGGQINDVEYRFGYWTLGRIGRKNGVWTWGQYSLLAPPEDWEALITAARRDGTLLLAPIAPTLDETGE
jgi:hypothetical protein